MIWPHTCAYSSCIRVYLHSKKELSLTLFQVCLSCADMLSLVYRSTDHVLGEVNNLVRSKSDQRHYSRVCDIVVFVRTLYMEVF